MAETLSRTALVRAHPGPGWTIVGMLLFALGFFVAGIFCTFTTVTKLWLFQNQVSVYRGLIILWNAGEIFLFLILFVFTICFPCVKINAMLGLWLWPQLDASRARQWFGFVANMGKWSMLDVFVVAILVLTIKSTGLGTIRVGLGFYLFFLSVMLTQFASLWTGRVVGRLKE